MFLYFGNRVLRKISKPQTFKKPQTFGENVLAAGGKFAWNYTLLKGDFMLFATVSPGIFMASGGILSLVLPVHDAVSISAIAVGGSVIVASAVPITYSCYSVAKGLLNDDIQVIDFKNKLL